MLTRRDIVTIVMMVWLMGMDVMAATTQPVTSGSTTISKQSIANNPTVTVNVMHYFSNITYYAITSSNCPNGNLKEWNWYPYGSYSDENDYFYSQSLSNGRQGPLYYLCNETYFQVDPYYQQLKNNTWTACNSSPGLPNAGNCSIYIQKPPVIRLIAPVPTTGPETAYPDRGSTGANDRFYDVQLWINGSKWGYTTLHPCPFTTCMSRVVAYYVLDSSATPSLQPYYTFQWEIEGPSVGSDPWYSSVFDFNETWGTYYCGPNFTVITPNQFGGTCFLACQEWDFAPGTFNGAPWRSRSWSGDSWIGYTTGAVCSP